jgi:hypothetical protein
MNERMYMRRTLILLSAALGLFGVLWFSRVGNTAPPAADPWEGTYVKFAEHDWQERGGEGQAPTITITKDGDGYVLSKPYDGRKFREIKPGVLADHEGGIGKIYGGSYQFANGAEGRMLCAGFCYETFYLFRK